MLVMHLPVLAQQLQKRFSFGDVDLGLSYGSVLGVHLLCYRCSVYTQAHVSPEIFFLRAKFVAVPSCMHTLVRNLEVIVL